MNILFVCKYNKFRSRIARAYFDKLNKNKNIKTEQGGIFPGRYPLSDVQQSLAKEMGIDIEGIPRPITTDVLRWTDLIIDVADDVPISIFSAKDYGKKIEGWKIPDNQNEDKEEITKIIKLIMKKVEDLVERLNKEVKK